MDFRNRAKKLSICPPGSGHQAIGTLVTRNEEQPVQVGKLHATPAVSHAGQRGRPHRAEEDQVRHTDGHCAEPELSYFSLSNTEL